MYHATMSCHRIGSSAVREQAKISSMTLVKFKGVKIGGQALEQVQVTTDIVDGPYPHLSMHAFSNHVEQVSIPCYVSGCLMGTYQIGCTLAACCRFHWSARNEPTFI